MTIAYTIPPDTRAVGSGNPAADMNNTADVLTGMGAGYSVLNTTFSGGADPTGAADSAAAIQAALNAAPAGQNVYLPPGTYKLTSPLTVPDYRGLLGQGARPFGVPSGSYGNGSLSLTGAILKPASTFTGARILYLDGSGGGQHGGQLLADFAIDGSSLAAGNTVNGIQTNTYVAGVTIRDVLIYGGYAGTTGLGGIGLSAQGTGGANPDFFDVRGLKVSACKGVGIQLNGLADSIFTACEATGNNGDNWNITNGSNSRYIGCKGENSGAGWDLNLTGFTGFTGYAEFVGFTGGGGASGAIQVSGAGTGTFYFTGTHIVSGAVTLVAAQANTVKSATWPNSGTSGAIIVTS